MKNIISLMKVEMILTKRQAVYFLLSIGMPTGFYLLFSGLMQKASADFAKSYLLSMTVFSMMSAPLFSLPSVLYVDKINNWQKSLSHSPVSVVEYYISKFLSVLFDYILSIVIVFSVGHFVRQVNMPWQDWFISAGILLLGSISFIAIGLLLTLIPSIQLTSVIGNIVYISLAVLGGLWFPITMFPDWMKTLGKATPSYQLMNVVSTYLDKENLAWGSVAYLLIFTLAVSFIVVRLKK